MASMCLDVAIVGGGAAGLATAACLRAVGVRSIVVFDQLAEVGQVWRERYSRLTLHDIKDQCHLPLLDMPSTYPRYVPTVAFAEYLRRYAEAHKIDVRTSHRVVRVAWDATEKLWHLHVVRDGCSEPLHFAAKHTVFACGLYQRPITPDIPGLGDFGGMVLHSATYTSCAALGLRGKRVLVVGCGNSGSEIALDLAEGGAYPTLFIRSNINIVPRFLFSSAQLLFQRLWPLLYIPGIAVIGVPLLLVLMEMVAIGYRIIYYRGSGVPLSALPPLVEMLRTLNPPVQEAGVMESIRCGAIRVKHIPRGALRSLNAQNRVFFTDGTIEEYDAVVLATGFEFLTSHSELLSPSFIVSRIGSGKAALRRGTIHWLFGNVSNTSGVEGIWFVFNRLQMINFMSRYVADAIARQLRCHNGRNITSNIVTTALRINVLAAVGMCMGLFAVRLLSSQQQTPPQQLI